jgi:hypothetical protein
VLFAVIVCPSEPGQRTLAGGLMSCEARLEGRSDPSTTDERLKLAVGARHDEGVPPIVLQIDQRVAVMLWSMDVYFVIVVNLYAVLVTMTALILPGFADVLHAVSA